MVSSTASAITTNYGLNGLGQRVSKSGSGVEPNGTRLFAYDEAGHLVGEYDGSTGEAIEETVWLNDLPVAILTGSGTGAAAYYVHPDHLGAPKVINDGSGNTVWAWGHDPFGNGQPSGTFTYNLRYPGQYYDSESNLNYNMNRDYDPVIGRYIQSDPIGLKGGVNTYGYVGGNPLWAVDKFGLAPGDSYASEDAAAYAALGDIYQKSMHEGVEYGGRIYQKDLGLGPYSYTPPIKGTSTKMHPGECPTGTDARGYYHTHPYVADYDSESFSRMDEWVAKQFGYAGYLATPSGRYLKYTPMQ